MRLHAPIPSTLRVAAKDDLLPLTEPITNTRDGKPMHAVPIAKGTSVFIRELGSSGSSSILVHHADRTFVVFAAILNLNSLDELWGGDGKVFRSALLTIFAIFRSSPN